MRVSAVPEAAPSLPAPGGELVRATGIGKSWGGTRALDGVDIEVRGGEILALVGENGAGKSTLMNILSGIIGHGGYEGTLAVDGRPGHFANPHESEKAGIVLVPQELRIAPGISVGENMFMGHLPRNRLGMVDFDRISRDARRWLRIFDMPCAPEDLAGLYSTAEQRMMMIAGRSQRTRASSCSTSPRPRSPRPRRTSSSPRCSASRPTTSGSC
ncbi:ATP-binding cassette domain-containing protein [Amaricoccus solimangrovi]|uniref:Sugar ABC transporter ATP-binding protein n=1 Tax=Amaricoccus solimangrovi TaxID=2589815 RepID=A0A501W8M0_9RHOB|nr:ATP-binding cassette domain-containing protein [Amaricoccus solimangrovi]TPE45698.1 sugar ABC transporter ATP-binding protein [Amaricoccus solimangrovi]